MVDPDVGVEPIRDHMGDAFAVPHGVDDPSGVLSPRRWSQALKGGGVHKPSSRSPTDPLGNGISCCRLRLLTGVPGARYTKRSAVETMASTTTDGASQT